MTTEAGQEKRAGWPVVQIERHVGTMRPSVVLHKDSLPPGPSFEKERYVPESTTTGLVEALEGAEDFIERVQEWTGADEDEQAEAMGNVRAALSAYKREVEE